MKKKWRVFFFVLYFLITFVLGFFIAIILPGVNFDILQYEKMNSYVETKQFVNAMDLIGGLYNEEKHFIDEFDDDSGLIIFEANSFYMQTNEDETKTQLINNSYVCFLYGIDDVNRFSHESLNVSRIRFNENEESSVVLSKYYEELKKYTIETLINSNYICFSVDQLFCEEKNIAEVGKIEVFDANGNKYYEIEFEDNLTFKSDYFNSTRTFVEKYNEFFVDKNFNEQENIELENIYNSIKENNTHYTKSGTYVYGEIRKEANREAAIFVLIYFIWIYILGDFLVGPRYILRFLTFIFGKIKTKKVQPENETVDLSLGFGFISTISIEVKTPEDFNGDIIVEYEHTVNPEYNFKTSITRAVEYKKKERVHGGSYKLVSVECLGFEVVNLPEVLEVKGYTMKLSFEIKHKNN